jgi:hypothetical protein
MKQTDWAIVKFSVINVNRFLSQLIKMFTKAK